MTLTATVDDAVRPSGRDVFMVRVSVLDEDREVGRLRRPVGGRELRAAGLDVTPPAELGAAFVAASIEQLAALVRTGAFPQTDDRVIEIRVSLDAVVRRLGATPAAARRLIVPRLPESGAWSAEIRKLVRVRFANLFGFAGEHTIDLDRLVCVVGENGSGKSSLPSLLKALSMAARGFPAFGPETSWLHRAALPDFPTNEAWIEAELSGAEPLKYRIELLPDSRGAAALMTELLVGSSGEYLRSPAFASDHEFRQQVASGEVAVIAGPRRFHNNGVLPQLSWACTTQRPVRPDSHSEVCVFTRHGNSHLVTASIGELRPTPPGISW